jgi:hypothetical protein
LTPPLIVELERKTNCGVGALCNKLFARNFHHADVAEVIRLALIGGGTSPAEAAALVNAYVVSRPLAEPFPIAVAVLEHMWFGKPNSKDAK